MTDALLIETAANVLNAMFRATYFDITALDKACGLIGSQRAGDAYERLRKLHCVHWEHMPAALRNEIPKLVEQVVGTPMPTFDFGGAGRVFDAEPRGKTGGGFLRLLGKPPPT